jgi:hypothetical protein
MSARLLPTVLVVLLGLCALILSIRWIAATDRAPWTTSYRRYGNIDQRRAVPIGIGVDTFIIAAGVASGVDRAYWVGLVALAAVQTAMVALILVIVRQRGNRRRPTR